MSKDTKARRRWRKAYRTARGIVKYHGDTAPIWATGKLWTAWTIIHHHRDAQDPTMHGTPAQRLAAWKMLFPDETRREGYEKMKAYRAKLPGWPYAFPRCRIP